MESMQVFFRKMLLIMVEINYVIMRLLAFIEKRANQ